MGAEEVRGGVFRPQGPDARLGPEDAGGEEVAVEDEGAAVGVPVHVGVEARDTAAPGPATREKGPGEGAEVVVVVEGVVTALGRVVDLL